MSILTPLPPALPFHQRAFYSIPLLGWLARDVAFGDADNIYYFLIILATFIVLATATWGLPALVMICLVFVPLYMTLMVIFAAPWQQGD
ncbi:hypothetical protein Q4555_12790 [Octadecabacter sp. 1_MG-2023]|uniref:hypothetical protein n=1 Tax=unclassified Octadecabacter TaxID=196158 RepID=UPI001C0A25F4|nr:MULTISPECIES: hypothetical protein [unclassified Octadecabacter]MBU2993607.1 hypothetical protein [Octadecabacter sp. B2R22]MDO6735549.1 hypothetical protein [Octadecabacter sp. 1_MG-2023]